MANLLITNLCNRKYSFGFAQHRVRQSESQTTASQMSRADIRRIAEFLKRSEDRQLRLLGGEPTLHPEFTDIATEFINQGFAENDFLPLDRYRKTGRTVARLARECFKENILVGLDCGFTLSLFSEEEIGLLVKQGEGFKAVCRPVIDVGPDLDIWHCFPLTEVLNMRMEFFNNRREMATYYNRLVLPYRGIGSLPECQTCQHLRLGQCTGGCLAHAINSFNRKPPKIAPKPAFQGQPFPGEPI